MGEYHLFLHGVDIASKTILMYLVPFNQLIQSRAFEIGKFLNGGHDWKEFGMDNMEDFLGDLCLLHLLIECVDLVDHICQPHSKVVD